MSENYAKTYARRKARSTSLEGKKRINPLTNEFFKMRDCRESDNRLFYSYNKSIVKQDGFFAENWLSPKAYKNKRINGIRAKAQKRAVKDNLKFNLDLDYLISIFPKNNKCPVTGAKISFTSKSLGNRPSLDKIIPSKGYTKGNVAWISNRANTIKNNMNESELKGLMQYLRDNLNEQAT